MRTRRRGIRASVRAEVIARDGLECRYCGTPVTPIRHGEPFRSDHLHLDHVTPWAMGGSDNADNLVVACAACNLRRPRPARGSSARRLLWERDDGEYYWRSSRYRPSRALDWVPDRDVLFTLEEAAEIMRRSVEDVLVLVTQGVIRGTRGTSYPIRVQFPEFMNEFVEERMDELGWED